MIRFACPRCKSILVQPDSGAGTAFACPSCGQRLHVPTVAKANDNPASTPVATQQPPPASLTPPTVALSSAAPSEPSSLPPKAALPARAGPPPLDTSQDSDDLSPGDARPRRRSWDREEDEDHEDDDVPSITRTSGRRGRYSRETAARAASSGFVVSLISLGLLVVTFIVWLVAARGMRGRGPADRQPLVVIALVMVLASFVLAIVGIIFSTRGLDESNSYNRGQGTAGVVCSIIALVIASLVGLFFLCIGMMFSLPGRW